jgi:hypothetical protein
MTFIKQYHKDLMDEIKTDGCLFRTLQNFSEVLLHRPMAPVEINVMHRYAVPDFMKDGGHIKADRCYILNHEEIIRLGFLMAGVINRNIIYAYRRDGEEMKIHKAELKECNFFAAKVSLPGGGYHFYRSDQIGNVLWNPGRSTGPVVSIRGYIVI